MESPSMEELRCSRSRSLLQPTEPCLLCRSAPGHSLTAACRSARPADRHELVPGHGSPDTDPSAATWRAGLGINAMWSLGNAMSPAGGPGVSLADAAARCGRDTSPNRSPRGGVDMFRIIGPDGD